METEEGRALMLASVLPAGTDRYVALYLGNPIDGGVELTLTGYARVGHQDWSTTVPTPGQSERANASPVLFPNITQAGTADYWAIFDAAVGGNLLRIGLITDIIGVPSPVVFSGLGDQARFPIGALRIKVMDD
jgi:hypothetical protein